MPRAKLAKPILADAAHEADKTCYFARYLPSRLAVIYESRVDQSHTRDFAVPEQRFKGLLM